VRRKHQNQGAQEHDRSKRTDTRTNDISQSGKKGRRVRTRRAHIFAPFWQPQNRLVRRVAILHGTHCVGACVGACAREGGEGTQAGGWTFSRRNMIGESTAVSLFIDACAASPGRGETQPYRGQALADTYRQCPICADGCNVQCANAGAHSTERWRGVLPGEGRCALQAAAEGWGTSHAVVLVGVLCGGAPGRTVRRAGEASFFGMSMRLKTSASAYGS
jgi:hypothetical protein